MDLSFTLTKDDILNATIRNSNTDLVMYETETPKYAGGAFTTTATRRSQIDGSTRLAFRIVWGMKKSLEGARVVLDHEAMDEVPVRQVLERAPGTTTYGSVYISGVEHRWKSKGTGSKVVLINQESKQTVARSHSRIRGIGFFRKPRDMSLEISPSISHAVDLVLLTFVLAWTERQNEMVKLADFYFEGASL